MSTFQSFEDIEAWQKARELTRRVYELSDKGSFAELTNLFSFFQRPNGLSKAVWNQRHQVQGRVANLKLET